MKRKTKRVQVTCSTGFFLVLAALIYLDGQGLVLLGALACFLHEAGHWCVIRILGGGVRSLRLTAVGAEIRLDPNYPMSYGREMTAALAGPAVNLVLAWICVNMGWFLFAGMNLSFGLLNLLPVYPLDGGRTLFCILNAGWPQSAGHVIRTVSVICAGILLGLGWFAWIQWENLTLLLGAIWLLVGVIKR